jgi:hypothetical protein
MLVLHYCKERQPLYQQVIFCIEDRPFFSIVSSGWHLVQLISAVPHNNTPVSFELLYERMIWARLWFFASWWPCPIRIASAVENCDIVNE